MPRFWRNKTGKRRKVVTVESMRAAVLEVVNDGGGLRKTADKYEINKQTLSRYIRRYRDSKDIDVITPKYKSTQVFSSEEESALVEHLKQSSELHNGLNPIQVRQFVYEFALKNNKRFPYQWTTNQAAGSDWYREFMQRNRDLSLGKPKGCSADNNTTKNDPEDWPDYIDVSVLVKEEIITDSSASSTHSKEEYSSSELPATLAASQAKLRCSRGRTNGTSSLRDLSLGKPKGRSTADNTTKTDPDYLDVSVLVKKEIVTDSSASSNPCKEEYSTSELPATPSASQAELRCSRGRTNGSSRLRDARIRSTPIPNSGEDDCDMFLKFIAKQLRALKNSSSKQKLRNGILKLMMEVEMEDHVVAGPSHDRL